MAAAGFSRLILSSDTRIRGGFVFAALLLAFMPPSAFATTGGLSSVAGTTELPLSVGGVAGIDLVQPGTTPTQLPTEGQIPPDTKVTGNLSTAGSVTAAGLVTVGKDTTTVCTTALLGAIRYNNSTGNFEGCSGSPPQWNTLLAGGASCTTLPKEATESDAWVANGAPQPAEGVFDFHTEAWTTNSISLPAPSGTVGAFTGYMAGTGSGGFYEGTCVVQCQNGVWADVGCTGPYP